MSYYIVESQVPHTRSSAQSPWVQLMNVVRRISDQRRKRRDINALMEMDNHMLTDIGLSRGEIEHAVLTGCPPVPMSDRVHN